MAKILVADDNSNVQKTVALALAELGVEVVAVNNGDAAVRKLADISPDLVLADIFMPVRNGYEVCEFVKKDSRFSHVPVVLLVGAFDPLDEPEAQRVGADGILKKPFVPPDPLIAMVKTLLDRTAGDRLVAVAISKPAVSVQAKAGGVAAKEEHPAPAEAQEELPEQDFPPPMERLTFGKGDRPIAFEQLLETPAQEPAAAEAKGIEPVDNEQILTSSRDSSLGDPIFWRTEEPAPNTEEGDADADISSGAPSHAWNLGEDALSRAAEPDLAQPEEVFELVRDDQDEESGQKSTIVESTSLMAQDAASQASLTVEAAKPEDLAANPIEWMASVPPPPVEEIPESAPEWNEAIAEPAELAVTNEATDLKSIPEPVLLEPLPPAVPPVSVSSRPQAPPPEPPPAELPVPPKVTIAAQTPDPHKTQPSLKPLAQSAEDTARSISKHDWADLAATLQIKSVESVTEKSNPAPLPVAPPPAAPVSAAQKPAGIEENAQPAPANSAPADEPDAALVEAVVQRVLDKMRPQVVDIITKEFLRPVVQALVNREIQKR